jgi:hypothetical protein
VANLCNFNKDAKEKTTRARVRPNSSSRMAQTKAAQWLRIFSLTFFSARFHQEMRADCAEK